MRRNSLRKKKADTADSNDVVAAAVLGDGVDGVAVKYDVVKCDVEMDDGGTDTVNLKVD
jgi:hypothetical protein